VPHAYPKHIVLLASMVHINLIMESVRFSHVWILSIEESDLNYLALNVIHLVKHAKVLVN